MTAARASLHSGLLYFRSVERQVKERLIGAAVLMAAAIILIPEMLSGPDREAPAPATQAKTEAPLKTYTIDLQQQTKPATPAVVEERAPPPEAETPSEESSAPPRETPPSQAIPEPDARAPAATAMTAAVKPTESAPPAPRTTPVQTAAAPSPPVAQSTAPAATPAVMKTGRWAVQLGSFSKEETARRLADEVRRAGHETFVMPVRSGSMTLYRVRVGPMNDRASADAALSALKAKAPGAAVVSHP